MAEFNSPANPKRKPWAITFFGLLAAAGLIAMPYVAGAPDGDKMSDTVRFIGRFHPILLHLPIGVFLLILVQELGAIFGRKHHEEPANPSLFPLFFGAVSAIVAVIAGFMLFQGTSDYAGSALAERHMWAGLAFAVAAVITFILKAWTVAVSGNPAFYRSLLFASVAIMGFASHDGGSITHGEDYLTKFAPDPLRSVLGLPKKEKNVPAETPGSPAADPVVFANIVVPMLEQRCIQCHKEGKAKGKLQMDSYEALVKGGKDGPALVAGSSEKSKMVILASLPEDDDDRMPTDGKPGLNADQITLLKWWIDQGADPVKKLSEFEVTEPIKEALARIVPSTSAKSAVAEKGTAASPHVNAGPDQELMTKVSGLAKDFPGALAFESQNSSLLTFTAVSMRGNLDDAGFKKLASIASKLVSVDLSATKVTDQAVAQLAAAKDLKLIRLAETAVTDASIDTLVKLPALESINLYGTKVTDAGVSKLASMPNLKRLYLWKTAVSPEAIKALQEKLPKCEIVTGIEA